MNKTELIGVAIAITLMPYIIGVWLVYNIRGGK
jgi:hypothetical protein